MSNGRSSRSRPDAARGWKPRAGSWANTCCAARAAPSCCSSTTRPIRNAGATNGESNRGEAPFFFKDGINEYVVGRREGTINPRQVGTKAAARYTVDIAAGGQHSLRLRLSERGRRRSPAADDETALGKPFAKVMESRKREADEFYAAVVPASLSEDRRRVDAPVAGGDVVEQAVLRLRRRHAGWRTAGRRRRTRGRRRRIAQRRLVAHGQRRRHLDARQMGVPLVRGLGPRVSLDSARRSSIPTSPRSSCCCCCRNAICTRTDRCLAPSGTSAT